MRIALRIAFLSIIVFSSVAVIGVAVIGVEGGFDKEPTPTPTPTPITSWLTDIDVSKDVSKIDVLLGITCEFIHELTFGEPQ